VGKGRARRDKRGEATYNIELFIVISDVEDEECEDVLSAWVTGMKGVGCCAFEIEKRKSVANRESI